MRAATSRVREPRLRRYDPADGNLILDSHVLLWWVKGERHEFSDDAWDRLRAAEQNAGLHMPEFALYELASKAERDGPARLELSRSTLERLYLAPGIVPLPATVDDWIIAAQLPWVHRDPFDRLIVSLAVRHGLTLVTADRRMLAYAESDNRFSAIAPG